MEYAKITVKRVYNKRGDLVLRSYIRALIKSDIPSLLSSDYGIEKYNGPYLNIDQAYIYGLVDESGLFHELFTGNIIDYSDYDFIDENEYNRLMSLPEDEKDIIRKIIEKVLFKKDNDLSIDVSNNQELSIDRDVESVAYDRCFSLINPLHCVEDESFDDYDNFLLKIKNIKKIKSRYCLDYRDDNNHRVYVKK